MPISGELDLDELRAVIKPDDFHFAPSALIYLENTHGRPLDLVTVIRFELYATRVGYT